MTNPITNDSAVRVNAFEASLFKNVPKELQVNIAKFLPKTSEFSQVCKSFLDAARIAICDERKQCLGYLKDLADFTISKYKDELFQANNNVEVTNPFGIYIELNLPNKETLISEVEHKKFRLIHEVFDLLTQDQLTSLETELEEQGSITPALLKSVFEDAQSLKSFTNDIVRNLNPPVQGAQQGQVFVTVFESSRIEILKAAVSEAIRQGKYRLVVKCLIPKLKASNLNSILIDEILTEGFAKLFKQEKYHSALEIAMKRSDSRIKKNQVIQVFKVLFEQGKDREIDFCIAKYPPEMKSLLIFCKASALIYLNRANEAFSLNLELLDQKSRNALYKRAIEVTENIQLAENYFLQIQDLQSPASTRSIFATIQGGLMGGSTVDFSQRDTALPMLMDKFSNQGKLDKQIEYVKYFTNESLKSTFAQSLIGECLRSSDVENAVELLSFVSNRERQWVIEAKVDELKEDGKEGLAETFKAKAFS